MAVVSNYTPVKYAGSTSSSVTNENMNRSRAWSDDITRNWNIPNGVSETLEDRLERYSVYFTLDKDKLCHIVNRFVNEINVGLQLRRANPYVQWTPEQCSLKLLDTCIKCPPTGVEKGTYYSIDVGGSRFGAMRITFEGDGKSTMKMLKKDFRDCAPQYKNGLCDKDATAAEFFDVLAKTLAELMAEQDNKDESTKCHPIGFTFSFPVVQMALTSARLSAWTKDFETARNTSDQVEGNDVGALLDQALRRNNVNGRTSVIINDTTGMLLASAYEHSTSKASDVPGCHIGFIIGTGVNGCYYQDDAEDYGYLGRIINTEFGAFDKGLPVTDVDLEADFACTATRGCQMFEKMISAMYIGDLIRRLVLKVFQKDAPELAWVHESLPSEAASVILSDTTPSLSETEKVLEGVWEWQTNETQRNQVKRIVAMVFGRSAALAAAALAALAKKTNRLQAALGGITVGIDGALYNKNTLYANQVRLQLDIILGEDISKLIHICKSNHGSAKGAAVLAAALSTTK